MGPTETNQEGPDGLAQLHSELWAADAARIGEEKRLNAALIESMTGDATHAELEQLLAKWRAGLDGGGLRMLFDLVEQAGYMGISRRQALSSRERNADHRRWVWDEWSKNKALSKPMTKKAFSEWAAKLIEARLKKAEREAAAAGLQIKETKAPDHETIRRYWLKGR